MAGGETVEATQLITWMQAARQQATGQVMTRILKLAEADPDWLAVHVHLSGQTHSAGEVDRSFALMSVIKPFLLLYVLEQWGPDKVFQWVGTQPSAEPFNSLDQLVADGGYPRNPMINSGAIALCDRMPGATGSDRTQRFCHWLNQRAGCRLQLDEAMLASVRLAGREPNQLLGHYLSQMGQVQQVAIALDTYEQICCLSGCVADLAQLGLLLACGDSPHRGVVNALMMTCGLYEASPAYAVRIGLPMKSGISGGLVAVVPGIGAIGCYSPGLDPVGNPVMGLAVVEAIAQDLQLSLFV